MKDEDYVQPEGILFDNPEEILGSEKFYTDEFDAFEKYYEKMHTSSSGLYCSAIHLATEVDQLPFMDACELSNCVERFPKKDEQNEEVENLQNTNEGIEFAHSSLKLVDSKEKGRHLVTTMKLEKGEVIINEKATVLQVNPLCNCLEGNDKMYRCHHCAYALYKFYQCTSCNIVVYCSVDCLVKAYNQYHKYECEALQRHYWKIDQTDQSYMAFRMMLYGALYGFKHELSENNQSKWGSKDNNYPYIYRLETHFHDLPVKKVYIILKEALKMIVYLIVRTTFFREFQYSDRVQFVKYVGGLLVKHYCQAQINSVLLRYPNFDVDYAFNIVGSTGKAICPTIALLNHACSPNAVIIPFNDRLLVKMIKSVNPDTEITISYEEINTFFKLKDRNIIMRDYFYFECLCECSFCTYESSWQKYPFKCHKCSKGKAKRITAKNGKKDKLICNDCKAVTDFGVKAEKEALVAVTLYQTNSCLEHLLRIVENYDKLFPWDSWMMLDAYMVVFNKYLGWEQKPVETIKYGIMYFSILDQYLPRLYPPCLEARLRFFYAVANTDSFMSLRDVSPDEYDTIKFFIDDCIKTKEDLIFYIPKRYLEFYYIGLLSRLETVSFNIKVRR